MMPTIPKMRTTSQVSDLRAAPVAVLFSDKIVPFLLYLLLIYLAAVLVVGFLAVAVGFLAGVVALVVETALVALGFVSKVGATTVRTAALTNSIRVPGVDSTITESSRMATIFPLIPPSMTTSTPTATEASSCFAALERFLLLKMIKAKKAKRMTMNSTENQSIGKFGTSRL
jgi:hypothetical protein